jgi:hypothetical protein
MRWVIYEFYAFKFHKKQGFLKASDFTELEDDMLYIIHKATVKEKVFTNLIVLSRLLNNKTDSSIRYKYKLIEKN